MFPSKRHNSWFPIYFVFLIRLNHYYFLWIFCYTVYVTLIYRQATRVHVHYTVKSKSYSLISEDRLTRLSLSFPVAAKYDLSNNFNICYLKIVLQCKGTVSRDFRLLVFFMNQFPPSPWVYHKGRFKFFRKFAEIFAAQGAPHVSLTPVANGKNPQT
jgi:hypothetical protein